MVPSLIASIRWSTGRAVLFAESWKKLNKKCKTSGTFKLVRTEATSVLCLHSYKSPLSRTSYFLLKYIKKPVDPRKCNFVHLDETWMLIKGSEILNHVPGSVLVRPPWPPASDWPKPGSQSPRWASRPGSVWPAGRGCTCASVATLGRRRFVWQSLK